MIIALLALALAMIAGGLLTAFYGWDIVLVERGWTMVIAGSITAASGALLLGVAAALSKLASIQSELARLREGFAAQVPAAPQAPADLSLAALSGGLLDEDAPGKTDAEARDKEETPPPFLVETDGRSSRLRAVGGSGLPSEEPVPPVKDKASFAPRPLFEAAPPPAKEPPGPKVPDFLLAERTRETHVETRIEDADESLYAEEREAEEPGRAGDAERPMDEEPAAEPAPETAEAEAVSEDESGPPTIIGTYNSGDNRYVMFSDGSIEAETPKGVFRFKSLEELKEFIASGGEGNSSAART